MRFSIPLCPGRFVSTVWRGEASLSEGARQGYQGILSAPYHLDGQKTSAQMFLADPIPSDTTLTADQQKLILGGEVCMWAEQLNTETMDSRVWPPHAAERFGPRRATVMFRICIAVCASTRSSLRMQACGTSAVQRPSGAICFLSVTLRHWIFWPPYWSRSISISARNCSTPTVGRRSIGWWMPWSPDPPSRQQLAGEVDAIAGDRKSCPHPIQKLVLDLSGDVPEGPMPSSQAAFHRLRQRFLSWQSAETRLLEDVQRTPRLSDAAVRSGQLGELAGVGLSSLAYLESHTAPPPGWQARQMSILDAAAQPSALVRFTVLYSMRKLVLAAAQTAD